MCCPNSHILQYIREFPIQNLRKTRGIHVVSQVAPALYFSDGTYFVYFIEEFFNQKIDTLHAWDKL